MEKYPASSPYVFFAGNPVKYIDPNGRQVVGVHGTWSDNKTWEGKFFILCA